MAGRDVGAVMPSAPPTALRELALQSAAVWRRADALLLPTAPTLFTAAEIAEAPIARNTLLGTYTNFVNLLDLCAIAVPAGMRADGLPFGVSLIAPAGARTSSLALARSGAASTRPATPRTARRRDGGARGRGRASVRRAAQRPARRARRAPARDGPQRADLSPLRAGGHQAAEARAGRRGARRGDGIELEIWELAAEAFGRFVAAVPAPLSIGTVTLADGRAVKGFLCESSAVAGAPDITAYGGWRAYRGGLRA